MLPRSWAGKPVVFKCKVHEVKETILPELDDEFAKDVSEFDTLKALKDDLKAKKLEAKKKDADTEFRNAVLDLAVANMDARCGFHGGRADRQDHAAV